ncbi:MAG TPA: hypothetical protein VEA19_05905, partial [Actinomycetota bacterium]|nr:hypothetical protein [Actinomycetota bacterium]
DQPARDGPGGIWVITRWTILQPFAKTNGLVRIAETGTPPRQVRQVPPPSEADATELLRAFLEARVEGDGAEEHLHVSDAQIPLMYATTSGAPYERYELDLVSGSVWPGGWLQFRVRLFADGGSSVVEQPFVVDRGQDGSLVLVYGTVEDGEVPTTENGEPLAEPYEILGGQVRFAVPPPWYGFFDLGPNTIALVHPEHDGEFAVLPDPLPVLRGCEQGRSETDAQGLAREIQSDPDLEATAPVVTAIGDTEALRMDLAPAPGASVCDDWGTPQVLTRNDHDFRGLGLKAGYRMRLYLMDLPEGSSARTLAIAFAAPEAIFETVLEDEARIVDSFEFGPR